MKEIAYSHHEKWNGRSYPPGLSGEKIPLSARLMAVADVYDALVSTKVYKDGISHDKAVEVIVAERGMHFDPDLIDAFVEIREEFELIARRDADSDADKQRKIEYLAASIAEVTEVRTISGVTTMP